MVGLAWIDTEALGRTGEPPAAVRPTHFTNAGCQLTGSGGLAPFMVNSSKAMAMANTTSVLRPRDQ